MLNATKNCVINSIATVWVRTPPRLHLLLYFKNPLLWSSWQQISAFICCVACLQGCEIRTRHLFNSHWCTGKQVSSWTLRNEWASGITEELEGVCLGYYTLYQYACLNAQTFIDWLSALHAIFWVCFALLKQLRHAT